MKSPKVYVDVRVEFLADGTMVPRELTWEDGTRYEIDRVDEVRQAAALKAGGLGERYTICVNGRRSYLFFERAPRMTGGGLGRWFVERRSA